MKQVEKLGPWSCYLRLLVEWRDRPGFGPQKIATKVQRFFWYYAMNRHKSVVGTPSIHLSAYVSIVLFFLPFLLTLLPQFQALSILFKGRA